MSASDAIQPHAATQHLTLASACHQAARWQEAMLHLDTALAQGADDAVLAGLVHAQRALILLDLGQTPDAMRCAGKALTVLCEGKWLERGLLLDQLFVSGNLAWARIALTHLDDTGLPPEAGQTAARQRSDQQEAWLAWRERLADARVRLQTRTLPTGLGVLLHALDERRSRSLQVVLATMAASQQQTERLSSTLHWYCLGESFRVTGMLRSAEGAFRQAISLAQTHNEVALGLQARLSLARVLRCENRWPEACDCYQETLTQALGMGLQQGAAASSPGTVVSPAQVTGRSVASVPTSRGHVERAARCLEQESRLKLSVQELAALCGVSRRTLEKAVAAEHGITVLQFIGQARMTRLKSLIRGGMVEADELASALGYASRAVLFRDVRRVSGRTLRDWIQIERAAMRPGRAS